MADILPDKTLPIYPHLELPVMVYSVYTGYILSVVWKGG